MSSDCRIIKRSRGLNGGLRLLLSTCLFSASGTALILSYLYSTSNFYIHVAFFGAFTALGGISTVRCILDMRRACEWEICFDSTHIRWIERDRLTERIGGEIAIRQIRRVLVEPCDGDPPSVVVELNDETRCRLPAFYLDTRKKVQTFVSHWRQIHTCTPLHDLESA